MILYMFDDDTFNLKLLEPDECSIILDAVGKHIQAIFVPVTIVLMNQGVLMKCT